MIKTLVLWSVIFLIPWYSEPIMKMYFFHKEGNFASVFRFQAKMNGIAILMRFFRIEVIRHG